MCTMPSLFPSRLPGFVLRCLIGLWVVAASQAGAFTLFFDDFATDPDGTLLNGKASVVGAGWQVSFGQSPVEIQNQSFDTSLGGHSVLGFFSQPSAISGDVVILTLTTLTPTNPTFHSTGFAGIFLRSVNTDLVFIGDLPGASTTWGMERVGGPSLAFDGNNGTETLSGNATVTLVYQASTGLLVAHLGADPSGTLLGTLQIDPGLSFDRIRLANGNGGNIRLDSVAVITPEPGRAMLLVAAFGAVFLRRRRVW